LKEGEDISKKEGNRPGIKVTWGIGNHDTRKRRQGKRVSVEKPNVFNRKWGKHPTMGVQGVLNTKTIQKTPKKRTSSSGFNEGKIRDHTQDERFKKKKGKPAKYKIFTNVKLNNNFSLQERIRKIEGVDRTI